MFESRSFFGLVLFLLLASVACSSSKKVSEESDDASQDAGSRDASDSDDADDTEILEDGGPDARSEDDPLESHCPNNIVEPERFEECDDGNYFDDDGCTRLCEFSCEDDDECDDLNDCNGKEKCNSDHACEPGEWAEDGKTCGSNKSCFAGLCLDDVCGDGVINENLGEDCDDGNNIDDDECSNRCTYGCTSDKDCVDGDPCAGTTTCDTDSHKCSGPTLDDETLCKTTIEDGWCMKNVCVPTNCGDGKKEGSEECDDGRDNGAPGSECSVNCRIVVCGNGTIEGKEECDDGEQVNMDSCDENCRAEIYFRWNQMEILRELAPEWCVHAGKNAFAKAFPGAVEILGLVTVDVLGEINDAMAAPIENCRSNRIIQVLDLADPSFKTLDDEVNIAYHFGELASDQSCDHPMDLDSELYLFGDSIEDGEPISTMPAIQRPGVLQSKHPIDLPAQEDTDSRAGALHDFKFLWQMDLDNLSTPAYLERNDGLAAIELPETMGVNPDRGEPYHAAGRLCAAMSMDGMKSTKIIEGSEEAYCCSSPESPRGIRKYHACPADDPDGDCENTADIVTHGCVICIDLSAPGMVSEDCGNGEFEGCIGNPFEVVHPTPADIDTDGDGEKDALSIVLGVEGVRVRSRGVKK
jgi:cysteine-rich repeat protein